MVPERLLFSLGKYVAEAGILQNDYNIHTIGKSVFIKIIAK